MAPQAVEQYRQMIGQARRVDDLELLQSRFEFVLPAFEGALVETQIRLALIAAVPLPGELTRTTRLTGGGLRIEQERLAIGIDALAPQAMLLQCRQTGSIAEPTGDGRVVQAIEKDLPGQDVRCFPP